MASPASLEYEGENQFKVSNYFVASFNGGDFLWLLKSPLPWTVPTSLQKSIPKLYDI